MPSQFEATAGSALGVVAAQTGSVTQATSKSTGVTLNTVGGLITMHDAALAAAAEVTFTVTNSKVTAGDVIQANHGSAGTGGTYLVQAHTIADGSFQITVGNVSGSSAGEAIVINYLILKNG
ncbi:MAG: hypothetical protein Unbinned1007contig1000_39 [Prokaryotic dsDNA virus sp.]|nr:MAG: hypothetical protein Unbinned1007contig1000_39 [Prokaryotic dsDNA virus sp.]|tara:strand:+ start:2749 stop:3114 length:366 start_codon:yes stop_codon:yes gene_type:complete